MSEPPRNPVACGALGRYDRSIVARVAASLSGAPTEVHADRRSCLWLDREPLRWGTGIRRGLAWSERFPTPDPGPARSWQDASCGLDACGLALGARRRAVHSSVSGAAPIYWMDHGEATYFASRIDALVRGVGATLDTDWAAWASMFGLRQPLGERTPFRQVRRLRQFSLLERSSGSGAATAAPWPWAEVEPHEDLEHAADATLQALHEVVAPLRETGAVVLLSGGLDSRVLLGVADDAGVSLRALTAVADDGIGWEAGLAAAATRAAGIEHEAFPVADDGEHRRLWLEHLETGDFQFFMGSFVMPMGPRLAELGLPALDGFALDTFGVQPGRSFRDEVLDPPPGLDLRRVLFRTMQSRAMPKVPDRALAAPYAAAALRSTRRQFRHEVERLRGSRSPALVSVYAIRGLRGITLLPMQGMGRHARVVIPCGSDRVARALLSVHPRHKRDLAFYRALLGRIDSPSARKPSVVDTPRPPSGDAGARNRFGPAMVELYEGSLRDGPLAPHLGPKLAAHLRDGTLGGAIRRTSMHRAVMALTAFHLWADRYSDVLRQIDPTELLEAGKD